MFGNGDSIPLYLAERRLYLLERDGGYYSSIPFFLARLFVEAFPSRLLDVIIGQPIVYVMADLRHGIDHLVIYCLVLYLLSVVACGVATLSAAITDSISLANGLMSLIFVIFMVFSGFLVNLDSLISAVRWISYISFYKYALEVRSRDGGVVKG